MDHDGNGEINLVEFLSFMREEGHYKQMRDNSFFEMLDASGRGTLAFMDVITLYYIIKSGRPFCNSCSHFIPGTFFSCVACFNHPKHSFSVCSSCHLKTNKKYDHKHDGRSALFLDNFTLLHAAKPHLPTTTSNQAAHTKPTGTSTTAKSQQPRKGDSASTSTSTSTSKNGDIMKIKKSPSVTPAKTVAKTSTPSKNIKSSQDQNAIVPAPKPAAQTKPTGLSGKGGSASTSKSDVITSYMTSELNRVVVEQKRPPPPSRLPLSHSRPLNHTPSVNVARNEFTTSTPNTFRGSSGNQLAIAPATQQVSWMKVASAAFKVLDAMVVVSNVIGVVSACTIM